MDWNVRILSSIRCSLWKCSPMLTSCGRLRSAGIRRGRRYHSRDQVGDLVNTDEQNTWAAGRLKQLWRERRAAAKVARELSRQVTVERLERLRDLERQDWGAWETP